MNSHETLSHPARDPETRSGAASLVRELGPFRAGGRRTPNSKMRRTSCEALKHEAHVGFPKCLVASVPMSATKLRSVSGPLLA
jgi:hypothetical protein